MLKITREQMIAFDVKLARLEGLDDLVRALNAVMQRYDINASARRIRYFIAQTAFETSNYTKFTESLYYTTASRIMTVWPSRFHAYVNGVRQGRGPLNAADYVRNSQKLANEVYANRMGNGSVASGDGWKFIGRGAIHLTGKYNYTQFSRAWFGDDRLLADPEMILDADYTLAVATAGHFWDINNLNSRADRDEFTLATKDIQGSTATANDRLQYLRRANRAFNF